MKVDVSDLDFSDVTFDVGGGLTGNVDINLCDFHSEIRSEFSSEDALAIWNDSDFLDDIFGGDDGEKKFSAYAKFHDMSLVVDAAIKHRLEEINYQVGQYEGGHITPKEAIKEIKSQMVAVTQWFLE